MTLTREEILAMEIGNELDIEVAVTVMGRERDKFRSGWIRLGDLSTYPKQYSKDISAAWEVVTHLMNDHKDVLVQGVSFEKNRLFDCAIYEHEDELAVTSMQSSAPEAICKCALLAVLNL
ncbi:BC1872 family protein [Paenibacillus pseudetheri]|uniref:Phage ABA sandwich domain-containing protein n=1 Tax=Paenibacillus pseudetheri TaxID=2897682 RepID=A0ABN8F7Q9_9BACL|nr:hypothetical protein [Paenibacillus pseudetheri]CAH1054085.1 hypothetical protein PAECIP111894_00230 [Paenibacillus pseudetheri]